MSARGGILPAGSSEDQTGVRTAEAEGVRHCHVHLYFPRRVWDVVQIALRIGIIEVDRRRKNPAVQGKNRDDSLYSTGSAEQMAGHGFCRADRYLIGIIAEHGFYGDTFEFVSELGGGSVGIDVAHFSWSDACVLDRHLHASRSPLAIWGRCGYMVSIT